MGQSNERQQRRPVDQHHSSPARPKAAADSNEQAPSPQAPVNSFAPSQIIALQRTVGNQGVSRMLAGATQRPQARQAPIQRAISIANQRANTMEHLEDLLGAEAIQPLLGADAELLEWCLDDNQAVRFGSTQEFITMFHRASAMVKLLRSIFTNGILSRSKLHESKIKYTGSEDLGNKGELQVNILDNRGDAKNAAGIAQESMGAAHRGSVSVAVEREKDPIQSSPEWQQAQTDPLTEQQEQEVQNQVNALGADDKYLADMVRPTMIENVQFDRSKALLDPGGAHHATLEERAQNTVMAVVPNLTKENFGSREPDNLSYEASTKTGEIRPGDDGFKLLLIPVWFEQFFGLVTEIQPQNLEIRYVGNRTITAHYKSRDHGDIPITIDAPDYASEVATELQRLELLATHILKT